MNSSLVPERPLLISPTLAATIGLEEAVMLHVLSELLLQHQSFIRDRKRWVELDRSTLFKAMPFWAGVDITRIQINLQEQGLLLIEPVINKNESFLFAINQVDNHSEESPLPERAPEPAPEPGQPSTNNIFDATGSGRASLISPGWQPNEDLFQQCRQHNVPGDFIEQRVRSFVMYWRERQKAQYSWHHTFLKWIIREWRKEQSYQGAKELETDMSGSWQPSEEATTILEHAGINGLFIEDSVPEFILYWRERGLITSTWNTKFIAHVRRQWAKFTLAIENNTTPCLLPVDYQPSEACFDVLGLANIDLDFARKQIPEFVLYWHERKEASTSWNTKFLQHVKFKWADQHQSSLSMNQQIENTIERFTDRSWAE